MVGRLVEQQHVRAPHQRLGQRHALLRAARKRADHGARRPGAGAAVSPRRAAPSSSRPGLDLRLAARRGRRGRAGVLVDQRDHVGDACAGGREDGGLRIEHRLLRDIGDAQALLQLQGAVVGLLQAGQDLEQRGLARAVAPDQADALARLEREIRVIQQGHMAEGQLRVEKSNECHGGGDYPAGRLQRHSIKRCSRAGVRDEPEDERNFPGGAASECPRRRDSETWLAASRRLRFLQQSVR